MGGYSFGGDLGSDMGLGGGLTGVSNSSDYSFSGATGPSADVMGLGRGLTGTPNVDNYGFSGGSYGLQGASNYTQAPGGQYSLDPSYFTPNYGLESQFNMGQLGTANYGLQAAGYQGLQAAPNTSAGLGMVAPSAQIGLQGTQPEQKFWGSRAQQLMSVLAGFHPVTAGINAVAQAYNSPNPMMSGLRTALGAFGGPLGGLASTAIGAGMSDNPAGYLGRVAGTTAAGMFGNAVGGPEMGRLASQGAGALMGSSSGGNYGAYGSGSALGGAGEAGAGVNGGFASAAGGPGGGMDWGKTLMSVGSGLVGLYNSNQQRQLAQQAISGSAPWQSGGGAAGAGRALTNVINGDFSNDPGFKAAQNAAARASSQQPGGMAASAAAQAALKYQNDRIQTLGAPAGVGFNPAQGYMTALQGNQQANELAGASLGSIGYGATGSKAGLGGAQTPAWLQQYLINNRMGS